MKKFDRFLEKLFHSKVGICAIAGTVSLGAFAFGGCFTWSTCACVFDAIGCDALADCFNACNDTFSCDTGCAPIDCLFGNGCEHDCGSCGVISCGGCNSSCFTDCELRCGDGSCNICNFSCNPNDATVIITAYYSVPGADEATSSTTVKKYDVPDSISFDSWKYSEYFDVEGYYYNGDKVVDADGKVLDKSIFKDSDGSVTVDAKIVEKYVGNEVLIRFDTSAYPDLILNSVRVVIGQTIDYFRTPEIDGYRFVGWKVQGWNSDRAPIQITVGATVFHLYDFGMSVNDGSVTLVPVFEKI